MQRDTEIRLAILVQFIIGLYFALRCDYLEREIRDLQQPTVVVAEKTDRTI